MSFVPQNQLERILIKAQSDPASRPQFYKDLVISDLFIIQEGPVPAQSGRKVLQEGQSLRIRPVDRNGKSYLPVFSSFQRLQEYIRSETGYIAINALEFMKITKGADLLLNPGSDCGKELSKEEVSSIIDGSIWKPSETFVARKETRVMIGQPSNYPVSLVDALTRYFRQTSEVRKAYAAHFFNPELDRKPHTLIGIEIEANGDWDKVIAGAGMVARDVVIPDPPVDFLRITGKGDVEDYLVKECKPFYKKKALDLF